MEEMIGFLLGNKQREKILEILDSKGSMNADKIAKRGHLTRLAVERSLGEMANRGLVSEEGDLWNLTELGAEVFKELKNRA